MNTDENGDLWLLNDRGLLFRVRDGKSDLCPGTVSPSQKPSLSRAVDGKLWVVSDGKVAVLENGALQPFEFEREQPGDYYERLLPARGGGVWVLAAGRLRKWHRGHWVARLAGCPEQPGVVTVLFETRAGSMLAGTLRDGLYVLTPGAEIQHLCRTNGLSHDWVRALCEDREGNIWVGTGAGLDTLRPRKVQMLNAPDDWDGCAVLSFALRPDGSAWVGTERAGLYRYDGMNWACYRESAGVPNRYVWSVLESRDGGVFVGTWGGGLLVKQDDHFVSQGELSKIRSPVLSMYEGGQGELWIGATTGIYRYEKGRITWSAGKRETASSNVRTIAQTPDGAVWFGMSGGGLASLKDGVLRQFRTGDGLSSDFVLCLHAEPDGTIWIGTADSGLDRLRDGRFVNIGLRQGIPSSTISHIVDDGLGNLWLGSQAGILRASKAGLNRCADESPSPRASSATAKGTAWRRSLAPPAFSPGPAKRPMDACGFPPPRAWL